MVDILIDRVGRWVATQYDVVALENWVGNHLDFRRTLPQTLTELGWAQALAIDGIRNRKNELSNEMSTSGKVLDIDWATEISELQRITRNQSEIIAILLDGWEPAEVVSISDLAVVVSPLGITAPNTKCSADIVIDFGLGKVQKLIIPVDELVVLPVPPGHKVKLSFKLNRDLRLLRKTTINVEVVAGQLGIILDLRGRPIPLPGLDGSGRQRVKKWREAICGTS